MASYMQLLGNIQDNTPVLLEDLEKVCTLAHVIITTDGFPKSKRHMHEVLASYVQKLLTSPVISLLDFETVWKERTPVEEEGNGRKYPEHEFPAMVEHFRTTQSSEVHIICVLLYTHNYMDVYLYGLAYRTLNSGCEITYN